LLASPKKVSHKNLPLKRASKRPCLASSKIIQVPLTLDTRHNLNHRHIILLMVRRVLTELHSMFRKTIKTCMNQCLTFKDMFLRFKNSLIGSQLLMINIHHTLADLIWLTRCLIATQLISILEIFHSKSIQRGTWDRHSSPSMDTLMTMTTILHSKTKPWRIWLLSASKWTNLRGELIMEIFTPICKGLMQLLTQTRFSLLKETLPMESTRVLPWPRCPSPKQETTRCTPPLTSLLISTLTTQKMKGATNRKRRIMRGFWDRERIRSRGKIDKWKSNIRLELHSTLSQVWARVKKCLDNDKLRLN